MYLIGVCLLEMGDSRAALTQFERTRDVYRDTSEGIAAGLQEADLLLAARRMTTRWLPIGGRWRRSATSGRSSIAGSRSTSSAPA